MSQKRIVIGIVAVSLLAFVLIASIRAQNTASSSKSAQSQGTIIGAQGGRFAMTAAYDNFLWVLDTQTGDIKGYRFVSAKDDKGEFSGFRIQNVPHAMP